jgi:predicted Zn-dependent protease
MLEQLTSSGKGDTFTWYALALEYKSAGRVDDATATFTRLRDKDPDYVPMYLMAGSMLTEAGRSDEAIAWLKAGIDRAIAKGDTHAREEMKGILEQIDW